jgi:hypothetical protein
MSVIKLPTQAERLSSLETQNALLSVQIQQMDAKLDSLLALRDKGLGAFWLASILLGTGFVGALATILGWLHK